MERLKVEDGHRFPEYSGISLKIKSQSQIHKINPDPRFRKWIPSPNPKSQIFKVNFIPNTGDSVIYCRPLPQAQPRLSLSPTLPSHRLHAHHHLALYYQ